MLVILHCYAEGPVDGFHRALDSDQPSVWRRSGHGEAIRIRPRNHGTVVLRRRAKALCELGHAQVFVKVWTLWVIKLVQLLSELSLIAQRQMDCQSHRVLKVNRTRRRSFAFSYPLRDA